jgi:DNA topoisomerase-3
MSYRLFICEKPSQAADLARNLGIRKKLAGYWQDAGGATLVTWCLGHLLTEFMPDDYDPAYKKWSLDTLPIIPEKWRYQVASRSREQYRVVSGLVKGAREVVIATDFDREGEAIARNILTRANFRGSLMRLCLTALDDASIQKALRNIVPGSETEPLYQAALGRARADWLVGLNLTRFYTLKTREAGSSLGVVSVGRVISPTVKLVVDRDLAIENFKPVTFYEILADMNGGGMDYKARWLPGENLKDPDGHVLDRRYPEEVIRKCRGQEARVVSFERKDKLEYPPQLFDLTSLQQHCSKRWGYSAQKTLSLAQSLYEKHKATTYPRTDSKYLPDDQFKEVSGIFGALEAQDPAVRNLLRGASAAKKPACYKTAKVTAHNAIVPTANANVNLAAMSPEERNVFTAIRRSFIAQFYPPAVYDAAALILESQGERFKAVSRILKTPGWKVLYESESRENAAPKAAAGSRNGRGGGDSGSGSGDPDDSSGLGLPPQRLPDARPGDLHLIRDLTLEEKETTPPKHFTEATLLAAMENIARYVTDPAWKKMLKDTDGLGTPATRAGIIDSALKWEYLKREGRNTLLSTPKSRYLITGILAADIASPGLTAQWEQRLEKIAAGDPGETEERFEKDIAAFVTEIINSERNRALPGAPAMPPPSGSGADSGESSGSPRRKTSRAGAGKGSSRRTASSRKTAPGENTAPGEDPAGTEKAPRRKTASPAKSRARSSRKGAGEALPASPAPAAAAPREDPGLPFPDLPEGSFPSYPDVPPPPEYPGYPDPGFPDPSFPPFPAPPARKFPGDSGVPEGGWGAPPENAPGASAGAPGFSPRPEVQHSENSGGFMYDPDSNPFSHTFRAMKGRLSAQPKTSRPGASGNAAQTGAPPEIPDPFPIPDAASPGQLPPEYFQGLPDMNSIFNDMSFGLDFDSPAPAPDPEQEKQARSAESRPRPAAPFEAVSPAAEARPKASSRPAPVPEDAPPPVCPKCGAVMALRNGIRGKFWSCTRYPDCRSTISVTDNDDGVTRTPGKAFASRGGETGKNARTAPASRKQPDSASQDTPVCPSCGSPMKKRQGPRGPFWGCSKYPQCRGTRNI